MSDFESILGQTQDLTDVTLVSRDTDDHNDINCLDDYYYPDDVKVVWVWKFI